MCEEERGNMPLCKARHDLWESQNHRMVEVGREVWISSGLNSLLKQGHQELVTKDLVQKTSAYLQGVRLYYFSG